MFALNGHEILATGQQAFQSKVDVFVTETNLQ